MHFAKSIECRKEIVARESSDPTEAETIVLDIEERHQGMRIDLVLFEGVDSIPSRSFSAKLIDQGFVLVNGKGVKPSHRLRRGESISLDVSWQKLESESPLAENIPLSVLYEDDHILVIDKPAGLVVHPGAGVSSGTLVNAVLFHCGVTLPSLGKASRAGIVHRLDRDTTGVMVVAKTLMALTSLSSQFAKHSQGRKYQALVAKSPDPSSGVISTWHARDPRNRLKYSVAGDGVGKFAELCYVTLETFPQIGALVECELKTGRTHQIRVQMSHISCPLIGDPLYGQALQRFVPFPHLSKNLEKVARRQMLHAVSLELDHPETGERVLFESPLPSDFQAVLMRLRDPIV